MPSIQELLDLSRSFDQMITVGTDISTSTAWVRLQDGFPSFQRVEVENEEHDFLNIELNLWCRYSAAIHINDFAILPQLLFPYKAVPIPNSGSYRLGRADEAGAIDIRFDVRNIHEYGRKQFLNLELHHGIWAT